MARILRDAGALDEKSSEKFELWIGLRNILVHGYTVIDHLKLFDALNEIEELKAITDQLSRYVDERSIDPDLRGGIDREIIKRIEKVLS